MQEASSLPQCGHICTALLSLAQQDNVSKPAALRCMQRGTAFSGSQLHDRVAALSQALTHALHVQAGDVIMVAAVNSGSLLELFLAATDAAAIVAPVNIRWSPAELAAVMAHTQPKLLVADAHCMDLMLKAVEHQHPASTVTGVASHSPVSNSPGAGTVLLGGEEELRDCNANRTFATGPNSPSKPFACTEALITNFLNPKVYHHIEGQTGSSEGSPELRMAPRGAAFICFTSGTTGIPKGVVLPHSAFHTQSLCKLAIVGYRREDVYLHLLPLFHVGGISSALAILMAGGSQIIMPQFNAKLALSVIRRHAVTSLAAVPTMVQDLQSVASEEKPFQAMDSMARVLIGAGGSSKKLQDLDCPFQRSCQEAAMATTSTSCDDYVGVCVGWPAPGVQVRVVPALGQLASASRQGGHGTAPGVQVRVVPALGQLASASRQGGHGTAGQLLWLMGRSKDMVKTGGENVHASEVEAVLIKHEGVLQAAVVGIPDERLGEMVAAAIVLAPTWSWVTQPTNTTNQEVERQLSLLQLQALCRRSQLAGFKMPRFVTVWNGPLPAVASSKVMKHMVNDQVDARPLDARNVLYRPGQIRTN
eukprot:gene24227-9826_t